MNKITDSLTLGDFRIQTLLEHVNAGVVIHAPDTSILLANKEASRLLGLSIAQMQGKVAIDTAWRFVRVDGSDLPLDEYPVAKAVTSMQSFENYIIGINRPNFKDLVWVEVNGYPEFNKNGGLSHLVITFVDITAQIESQKALIESEAMFSRVFQYSPGLMMITTLHSGLILETNNNIIESGYSKDEVIGKSILELRFWNDLSERLYFYKTLRKKGKIEYLEARFRRKTGEIFTCLISGEIMKFRGTDCIVSVMIDISDRKNSENEMNTLFEIVQGVVQTSDLYELLKLIHHSLKKVLYAENCFFALYDANTGLFHFPYFVDQYDDVIEPQALLKSCTAYVFRTGKSMLIPKELFEQLSKRNEVELVGSMSPSWIGVPLKTSSHTIGVLVLQHYHEENIYNNHHLQFLDSIGGQVANVIERKRAEEELAKSNSLIAATLESTVDGILVVDRNGKITNYNKKFVELWRIPESVLSIGKDEELLTFVMEQLSDPDGFLNKVIELYNNYEETSTDYIEFKDGRTFERYSQSQIFNGECVGRVWSFRDITIQKNTLYSLQESEVQLRELNATKDKFFSIIAHDLKSPFNGILGFSNILADQIKQKNYDNIEEYAEIIQFSSQKAIDLLMNLVDWSRSQSGRMDFNPRTTDVSTIIHEIFELLKISALQKSILLTKKIEPSIMASVDKEMISSALRNLITNAIKFTNSGGTVEIKAEKIGQELKITVDDTGIGMDGNELAKLFRIDQSYSRPGTQNEQGTGLGLILCKEFISIHGGSIWAESQVGQGSRFCFTIPAIN
ncbi:MAG: PAS domain S-box protein [Bacteroidia bacterium]|nr:PAS domain S-box protein [Bacteroidia bacterium]